MTINWPWRRAGNDRTRPERKAAAGFVALHMDALARWTNCDYAGLAKMGFMRNPIAHRAVRMISEAAASTPWLIYEHGQDLDRHPILDLVERPNPRQSGQAFMEALYGHLLISGNAYLQLIGEGEEARELHLLRPDRTTVVTDAAGWPVALDVREKSGSRRIALGAAQRGWDNSALHLKLFHPLDEHYGFPPLEAALMALDTHNAAGQWNKALLDNSARPSGALVYAPKEGGNLTDEQYQRLKSELEDGYSGAARAGRPLLLEGGLDWKAMSLSPKDMDFFEAKNGAARDIALALGVPPMLLGIPGDNTYANYQEANRAFYRLTVLPLVSRTAGALSAWLSPAFGDDVRLWFDADQVAGLTGERDALWARVGAADFLSDDEKREAVGYGGRGSGLAHKYRANQARVPAGNPDGGQWTDDDVSIVPVQSRPRGPRGGGLRRIGGGWRDLTPEQDTRLEISQSQMEVAVRRVQELDPKWKPAPGFYETVEGEISANEAARSEAEDRLYELQRKGIGPGPYAVESQPARGAGRRWTAEEIRENNRIGKRYGCHTCGTTEPDTPKGDFILDHQDSIGLIRDGRAQRIFPHCLLCSLRQGGFVNSSLRGQRR